MHPFLINFLTHYRLCLLQYVPNVFRIVMGTTILNERLVLDLTAHDISYVYRIQKTGINLYTLIIRNLDRKLVTGLPDSNKGRDKGFLVVTRNWRDPIFCRRVYANTLFMIWQLTLVLFSFSDKEFTKTNIEFVQWKFVEYVLKKACFVDARGYPCSAPILLNYTPSYNTFQDAPRIWDPRLTAISVSNSEKATQPSSKNS